MDVIYFFKKLGYNPKIDNLLTIVYNRIIIDLYDFEEQVYSRFGINENEIVSLNDILKKYYDNDTIEKIKFYTGA